MAEPFEYDRFFNYELFLRMLNYLGWAALNLRSGTPDSGFMLVLPGFSESYKQPLAISTIRSFVARRHNALRSEADYIGASLAKDNRINLAVVQNIADEETAAKLAFERGVTYFSVNI